MHRRRDSVRRYLRQQYGYGKAEALLERKWPSHYNRAGASRWSGRIYEQSPASARRRRRIVRYGTWGTGLFQSIYDPPPAALSSVLRAPESLLALVVLAAVSALGTLWHPLLLALPLLLLVLAWVLGTALVSGWSATPAVPGRSPVETLRRRALTSLLFGVQPFARLLGRLRNGLSPWRRRLPPGAAWPRPRTLQVWSEHWCEPAARVQQLQDALAARGSFVRSGGPFDRWDLELRTGPLGAARIRVVVEEHGQGRQLLRARTWPRSSGGGLLVVLALALLTAFAWHQGRADFALALTLAICVLVVLALEASATATSVALVEIGRLDEADRQLHESTESSRRAHEPAVAPPARVGVSSDPAVRRRGRRNIRVSEEELSG